MVLSSLSSNAFCIGLDQLQILSDISNRQRSIANQERQLEIQRQNQNNNFENNYLRRENANLLYVQKEISKSLISFAFAAAILNSKDIDNVKYFTTGLDLDDDTNKKVLLAELNFCTNVCNRAEEHLNYLVKNEIIESDAFSYAKKLNEVYGLMLLQLEMLKDYILSNKIKKIKNYDFNGKIINEKLDRVFE